ncbi:LiaF transmembrane domain-containing protein [Pedobacter metabolipauper]|uniref:Putative membrane protein n=1 Tax=Pedobacter metabolipauper TaxID=425513 RepID=A0A4R6SPJ8_9SPHI|nr:LiaF domain-containing protein [Pedobacter metabolipauper]TDQ06463.1 putative membrane protein [Pedobacter metabolipauper]
MEKCTNNSSSRIVTGVVILVVGMVFFLRNFGIEIPHWIISWHTMLIVIGLLVGYKRDFNGIGWLVMVLIGGMFTLADITAYNLSKLYFPIGLTVLGLFLILKPKSLHKHKWDKKWKKKPTNFDAFDPAAEAEPQPVEGGINEHDILDSVNVFGGSHQNIYSKNFKGGDVIAIFGGCDINLTQADFQGTITLDVVAIFGGTKIIIPSNWEVKSEVTAIFGGMDDKRGVGPVKSDEARKILIIKGVALFGGVDIRNF